MLQIDNVRKSFGSLEVLRGISLKVNQGDVAAILGPSGSGKTTLLRCLNFLETAGGGTMTFDGESFQMDRMTRKDMARLRKKTAFVFQDYNLFRNKTVLENVTEGLTVARKIPRIEAEETARRALDKVGMLDRAGRYPHQLSGGQQQRVAIARAIAASPEIISLPGFLPEPGGGALQGVSADGHSRRSRGIASLWKERTGPHGRLVYHRQD